MGTPATRHDSRASVTTRSFLQPWRRQSFKFSADPQLEAKVADIVGLYLNPPENAVVVCVDEKSQCQAYPDRTQPILPGVPEKATHNYVRHEVTTLFAALEIATGQVMNSSTTASRDTCRLSSAGSKWSRCKWDTYG